MLRETHPVLPVGDLERSVAFYTGRLGFGLAFRDRSQPDAYAGVRRGGCELHLQLQTPECMASCGRSSLRLLVDDPDALHAEYAAAGVVRAGEPPADKPWATRDFGLLDPDGHALTFYRDE